ncbi:MAG TPA: hypothetical protein VKM72_22395 [Thermoanaerobaculia bacterium]|nr:hypothetical protein [Thermoanaerobaculia bacterium]
MSRALLALALGFALGGPPLQWASSLVEVVLYGSTFDPNGSQSNPDYGSHFDPDGSQSNPDYGSQFDPNG